MSGSRAGIVNSWGLTTAPSGSVLPGSLGHASLEGCHWRMWQDGWCHLPHRVAQVPLMTSNQLSPRPRHHRRRPSGNTLARKHIAGSLGQANVHLHQGNPGTPNMSGRSSLGWLPTREFGVRMFTLVITPCDFSVGDLYRRHPGSRYWHCHQSQWLWEVQEGGDIRTPKADSCWRMAETSIILWSNYPPTKNK